MPRNNEQIISYPKKLVDNLHNFPMNHAIPCSILMDNTGIGGIFMVCPPEVIDYFDIKPDSPLHPAVNYRMVDYKKRDYVIEIWMQFSQEPEKYLKMHLNPHDKTVQKLLQLGSKTKMISYHFYDHKSYTIASAVAKLNEEHAEWIKRNFVLSSKLSYARRRYEKIAKHLRKTHSDTDRSFKFYKSAHLDYFVKEGETLVLFGN